ncbi:MAG: hypothetical protein ACP5E9_10675, partial [Candidatus Methanospirareceae archaeon]
MRSEGKIMTPSEKFIEAVGERDIDLLLLEEFHVSEQFQDWFAAKALGTESHRRRFETASHAVTDHELGESDLVAYYSDPHGRILAILIENKIDAPAQPSQATRYEKRGKAGINARRWNDFKTCIVGPSSYLKSTPDAAEYQVSITYEEMCEFFGSLSKTDKRYHYRKRMVEEAIEQNRRGYQPEDHPAVHQFWLRYWETVRNEFPELRMPQPKIKPINSDWPHLYDAGVRGGRKVVHKMAQGYVDLEIPSRGNQVE